MSLQDFEVFFEDDTQATKAFLLFDSNGDNMVSRREVGLCRPALNQRIQSLSFKSKTVHGIVSCSSELC